MSDKNIINTDIDKESNTGKFFTFSLKANTSDTSVDASKIKEMSKPVSSISTESDTQTTQNKERSD